MSSGALTVASPYNLQPAGRLNRWSDVLRGSSYTAANILSAIPLGSYLEIHDSKFNGESLVIFRRTDFDNLNMFSSLANKVSRVLVQINQITTTFEDQSDPKKVLQLISTEAQMGIEFFTTQSNYSSTDYFLSTRAGEEDFSNAPLPTSRKNRKK